MREALKEMTSGIDVFLENDGRWLMWLFIFLYALFSFNVLPKDVPLAAILVVFAVAPVKCAFLMFAFYTLWEYVSVFSFGFSLNLLLQVILTLKILLNWSVIWRSIYASPLFMVTIAFFSFLFLYGVFAIMLTGSFTGISMAMKVFFGLYSISFFKTKEDRVVFWKAVSLVILLSTLLSVLYGVMNDTSIERWLNEDEEYTEQLYGTLGTTRLGMFLVISLAYPAYYIQNKLLKIPLLAFLTVLCFKTVSITALFLLFFFFAMYLLYATKSVLKSVACFLFAIVVVVVLFDELAKVDFVKPIASRIAYSVQMASYGDIDAATSNREGLSELAISKFQGYSFGEKLFGSMQTATKVGLGMHTHNSYLDMLLYDGLVGLLFFFLFSFCRVFHYRSPLVLYPVLVIKGVLLLAATSVSIMSASFWLFFVFI